MGTDSRDMQWCYWRGELVQAGATHFGIRSIVVHGSHWHEAQAFSLVDEEVAVFQQNRERNQFYWKEAIAARSRMKQVLQIFHLKTIEERHEESKDQ